MTSAEEASAHGFLARISRMPLDLRRQQVGAQSALAQALDSQTVSHGERRQVVLELRGRLDLFAGQLGKRVKFLDLLVEVLLEKLLQARAA